MRHNPLRGWIIEFLHHRPDAKPAEAWYHLTAVALPLGVISEISYDPQDDALRYRPNPASALRTLSRASFRSLLNRVRKSAWGGTAL